MLRYLKGVVTKAYSIFQEKLPDEKPPELSSMLPTQDGRAEDSRYPNLLNASAREDFGL